MKFCAAFLSHISLNVNDMVCSRLNFLYDPSAGGSPKKETSRNHGDLNDPRIRLKRDCVGIMAAFRLKGPFDHVVIVANTHLYW